MVLPESKHLTSTPILNGGATKSKFYGRDSTITKEYGKKNNQTHIDISIRLSNILPYGRWINLYAKMPLSGGRHLTKSRDTLENDYASH